jgi:hypothetical protein
MAHAAPRARRCGPWGAAARGSARADRAVPGDPTDARFGRLRLGFRSASHWFDSAGQLRQIRSDSTGLGRLQLRPVSPGFQERPGPLPASRQHRHIAEAGAGSRPERRGLEAGFGFLVASRQPTELLQPAEAALDAIALSGEMLVVLTLLFAASSRGDDRFGVHGCDVGQDGVAVVALVRDCIGLP